MSYLLYYNTSYFILTMLQYFIFHTYYITILTYFILTILQYLHTAILSTNNWQYGIYHAIYNCFTTHYNSLHNHAATNRSASPLAGAEHTSPIFTEAPQGQGHGIDPGEILL